MKFSFAIAVFLLASILAAARCVAADLLIIGRAETVHVYPGKLTVRAKVDTGADTSSLHVPSYRHFKRDGKEWVEFGFKGRGGRAATIQRPVIRTAHVKDLTGPTQHRPVIEIGVCLGDRFKITQVTLYDRSGFNYRMLLGRRFLENRFLVDVSKKFLQPPNCSSEPG